MQKLNFLFCFLIFTFYFGNAKAQTYHQVSHTSGTQTIAGCNVTVVPVNAPATTTYCGVGPYHIGSRPFIQDAYEFRFSSPVAKVRLDMSGSDSTEVINFFVNGAPYFFTQGNITGPYTAASCSLLTHHAIASGGNLYFPPAVPPVHYVAGTVVTITGFITDIQISEINSVLGTAFSFYFDKPDTLAAIQPFADTVVCGGDSVKIPYNTLGQFAAGNTHTVQLSDASGSFAMPTVIGSYAGNAITGNVPCKIPAGITGTGYRVRIVSSNPARTSVVYDKRLKIGDSLQGAFTGVDTAICNADTLHLRSAVAVPGNFTYQWSGPNGFVSSAKDTFVAGMSATVAGSYIITATSLHCVSSDTLTVTNKPVPAAPLAIANSPLCEGGTLNLSGVSGTPGVSYGWSGPGGYMSNSAAPSRTGVLPAWSGLYAVTATLNGCSAAQNVSVTIHPNPAKPTAGSNSPVCVGGSLNLTASTVAGATYEWSGPATFGTTQQNPTRQNVLLTHGGKYSVVAKMNGCTSPADTTTVVVNAGPQVGMYPNPGDTICTGWDVTFTATPQNAGANPTFDWYRNGTFTGNSGLTYKTNAVSHGDTFTVRMTSSACNTAITSKPVRMNVLPTQDPPTISISATPGTHVWPWVEVTFKATTTKAGAKPGYQWKRNGADIPNGKDSILKMTDLKAGDTVCCVVTSNFLCAEPREVLSNCLVMNVDLSIGNQAKSKTGLRLYPNPTTGSFTLECKDAGTLVITNLQGQHIADYKVNPGINRISLPQGLAKGVYIGKLGNEVVRLVVE